jgi:hyperosmotically inducible protein
MNQEQRDRELKLKQRIEGALTQVKDFAGYDINLRVVNGFVTIYGIVDTLADMEHAQRVTAAVKGVKGVENDLTISTDGAIDDRDVYREVRQELDGDPHLNNTMIKLTVHKGRATLGGTVENIAQKNKAIATARKAMGVKEIIDNMHINSREATDDASIVNEVNRRFASTDIDANLFAVSCQNGMLSLQGNTDRKIKARAMEIAATVPGVKRVNADGIDTKYGILTPAAGAAKEIKESFARDAFLKKLPLKIYETQGRLVLEGSLSNLEQKRAVDKKLHTLLTEFGEEFIKVDNKLRLEG